MLESALEFLFCSMTSRRGVLSNALNFLKMIQKRLVLASASPRRKELFALTGLTYDHLLVEVDERPHLNEDPITFVTRIAREKGYEAARKLTQPRLVIAADTIVVDGSRILGKPKDVEQAERILGDLAGRSHHVITALAIVDPDSGSVEVDLCETVVPMRELSLDEINQYVATGSPMDKAGAYGIQDDDFHPVEIDKMDGCYANVMGLPLCHLTRSMWKFGLDPESNVPNACQEFTNYQCSVYPEILKHKI